jgi:uncharacterized membrane protein
VTPEDSARLEAISGALARMVARQRAFEERLARLEAAQVLAAASVAAAEAAPATPAEAALAATEPPLRQQRPEPSLTAAAMPASASAPSLPLEAAPAATEPPLRQERPEPSLTAAAMPASAPAPPLPVDAAPAAIAPPPLQQQPEPILTAAALPASASAPPLPLEAALAATEPPLRQERPEPSLTAATMPASASAPPLPLDAAPPFTPPAAPQQPEGLESRVGLTWVSRIGAITLILAVAFFFNYAFENHWITETGRVLLAVAAGGAALLAGERFWRTGQRTYGQALTVAGIAFLYLAFWAAHSRYHLLDHPAGFTLMALTTAAAGALSLRYNSQAVAALGLAGGYFTPLMLGTGRDPGFVLGYALLLTCGTAGLVRMRDWRRMEALSLAGSAMLYLAQLPVRADHLGFTLLALALYGVLVAGRSAPVAMTAQVLGGIAVAGAAGSGPAAYASLLLVAAPGLIVGDFRRWGGMSLAALAGFWLGYQALDHTGDSWGPLLWLTAGFLLFLCWQARGASRLPQLVTMAASAAMYFGTGYELLHPSHAGYIGLFAAAVAVVQAAAAYWLWERDRRAAELAGGIAVVLAVLAPEIQFTAFRVTMAWSLEGAALAWLGRRFGDRRATAGAALVFALVLVRLLFADSWALTGPEDPLLVNSRLLTFAIAAACCWAAAWWIHDTPAALVPYAGGHFVLVWGLSLEALAWAARTATQPNVVNAQSTAVSVLLAAYALALVAAGVARRFAVDRLMGMGLIGFVVLKLYLYDVWSLGLFYRMAAFAALGVLLLAMSYLYSRFRTAIESWWRPR